MKYKRYFVYMYIHIHTLAPVASSSSSHRRDVTAHLRRIGVITTTRVTSVLSVIVVLLSSCCSDLFCSLFLFSFHSSYSLCVFLPLSAHIHSVSSCLSPVVFVPCVPASLPSHSFRAFLPHPSHSCRSSPELLRSNTG